MVKLSDDFNGADLRNVCTEAGMFAIRAERDYVVEEDFMKAVRKVRRSHRDQDMHVMLVPVFSHAGTGNISRFCFNPILLAIFTKLQTYNVILTFSVSFSSQVVDNKKLESKLDYKPV